MSNHFIVSVELEFPPEIAAEAITEHRNRLTQAVQLALADDVVSKVTITTRWVPDE